MTLTQRCNIRHCVRPMTDDFRCFHSDPPPLGSTEELTAGTPVEGVVVCIHVFGLGIYLRRERLFGHVNVTAMCVEQTHGLDDYPPVGIGLALRVLGYSGGQLRLAVRD